MDLLLAYNDVAKDGDSANTANAYVRRDASGNINVSDVNCKDVVLTAALWLNNGATITSNTTIDDTHNVWRGDATGGSITITLPLVSTVTGLVLLIKRIDASGNTFTVKGNGAELIDNANTTTLGSRGHIILYSNGTTWDILA